MQSVTATASQPQTTTNSAYWQVFLDIVAYVLPVTIPVGLLGNLTIVVVISRVKGGVGKSAKVYYQAMAIAEAWMLIHLHLVQFFLQFGPPEWGLPSLTIIGNNASCVYIRWSYWIGGFLATWLYVGLTTERLVAVFDPLRARQKLNRRTGQLGVVGLFAASWAMWGYINLHDTALTGTWCDPGSFNYSLFSVYIVLYIMMDYFVPTALTVVLNVLLLWKTVVLARGRQHMSAGTSEKEKATLNTELRRNLTVVITCALHTMIYVPFASLMIMAMMAGYHDNEAVFSLNQWFHVLTSLCYCVNFFVYFTRIPNFRNTLLCRSQK